MTSSALLTPYDILTLSLAGIYAPDWFTKIKTVFGYCYLMVRTWSSILGYTITIVNLSFLSLILLFRLIEWLYYCIKILYFLFSSSNLVAIDLSTKKTMTPPSNLCRIHYLLGKSLFPSIFECKFNFEES